VAVVAEPEFMDGFDGYSLAQYSRKWTSAVTAPATLSTPGRAGITGTQAMGGFSNMTRAVTSCDVGVANFAFKTPSSFSGTTLIYALRESGNSLDNLGLYYNASGVMSLINIDSSTIATATDPLQSLQASTWYVFEVAILTHVSAGTVDVKVNGASVTGLFGLTAKKTSDSSNVYDTIIVTATGTGALMDDFYFRRGSTSYSNTTDFLGDIVIETVYPDAISGDAGHTQGTVYGGGNRFNSIDEPNAANDETDGVDLTANGQKLYTSFGSLVGPAASSISTIHAVQMNVIARNTDAGFPHALSPGCVKTTAYGTDYLGTSQALSAASFTDKRKAWATRPNGGGAWTVTDISTDWEWGCQRDS